VHVFQPLGDQYGVARLVIVDQGGDGAEDQRVPGGIEIPFTDDLGNIVPGAGLAMRPDRMACSRVRLWGGTFRLVTTSDSAGNDGGMAYRQSMAKGTSRYPSQSVAAFG
jgi:hypothetical protein